jgi:hypothetical protein
MLGGTKQIFDNYGEGFPVVNAVSYTEVGKLPITIRYSDDGLMFQTAITVVLEYCEAPAQVTVRMLDGSRAETKTLGGTPGCESVGVFRLYEQGKAAGSKK